MSEEIKQWKTNEKGGSEKGLPFVFLEDIR
ncbi:hypothetical protein SAMN04489735_103728 [Aneurinibacillus thermoaerophilus]|uniref:Uncharacterized protein n=1 Tax=Aneurinibacillus thermoaerophilus TaxID=143495 RepID=A0A1G8DWX6_ANETH|nr:hypothetical protein SAMN04489735_103728 [Aneurinibacillus thermoaerophilus]